METTPARSRHFRAFALMRSPSAVLPVSFSKRLALINASPCMSSSPSASASAAIASVASSTSW